MTDFTLSLLNVATPSVALDLSTDLATQNTASSAMASLATNFGSLAGSTLTLESTYTGSVIETRDSWVQILSRLSSPLDVLKINSLAVNQAYDSTTIETIRASSVSSQFDAAANLTRIPVSPRRAPAAEARLEIEEIAEWDGYVEEIHKDYFVARMRGLKGKGVTGKDEEAEIPISDIDIADRDLLVLGGFFRLTITYESPRVGPKRRYTTVQFRRLPAYSEREIEAARRLASELQSAIQLESGSEAARRRPG